jgi:Ca2+-binding RTX toxin-like protein
MKTIKSLCILALAITGVVESVSAYTPMCNGKVATHWINVSTIRHYATRDSNYASVKGSHADDVIVVDLTNISLGTDAKPFELSFDLGQSRFDYDMLCVSENPELKLMVFGGGEYIKADRVHSVRLNVYDDSDIAKSQSKYWDVSVIHGGYIGSGRYNDVLLVHSSTTTNSDLDINSADGDDYVRVDGESTDGGRIAAFINGHDGDDTIEFLPQGTQDRALVTGGYGADNIKTSNGDDLIVSSYLSVKAGRLGSLDVKDNWSLAQAFFKEDAKTAVAFTKAELSFNPDGGSVDAGGGDDYIFGTDGTDYLRAGEGHDYVKGYGARDRIWGGGGNDELYGDAGDDDVYGENGHDYMEGGDDDDLMKGGKGEDEVRGNDGADKLYGNEENDILRGGDGKDTLYGGTGNDYLRGDNQNDKLDGEADTDNCYGGSGDDELRRCE